jgi:discoidin domain receptor family member 2
MRRNALQRLNCSALQGKFSTKTDVWSFAVTLWEILTFARERPFESLTDEQVIQNCACYYQGDVEHQIVPPQPANCPREIYDLMVECWNPDAAQRPAFREVHMFLQRKNMGYNPADERRTPSRTTTPYV